MKRFQVKDYKVEEVKWLKKDGSVKSRCCKECGSDYLTENEVRKEIASRLRQLGNEVEYFGETWSIYEVMANTKTMYRSLIKAVGEVDE